MVKGRRKKYKSRKKRGSGIAWNKYNEGRRNAAEMAKTTATAVRVGVNKAVDGARTTQDAYKQQEREAAWANPSGGRRTRRRRRRRKKRGGEVPTQEMRRWRKKGATNNDLIEWNKELENRQADFDKQNELYNRGKTTQQKFISAKKSLEAVEKGPKKGWYNQLIQKYTDMQKTGNEDDKRAGEFLTAGLIDSPGRDWRFTSYGGRKTAKRHRRRRRRRRRSRTKKRRRRRKKKRR